MSESGLHYDSPPITIRNAGRARELRSALWRSLFFFSGGIAYLAAGQAILQFFDLVTTGPDFIYGRYGFEPICAWSLMPCSIPSYLANAALKIGFAASFVSLALSQRRYKIRRRALTLSFWSFLALLSLL